MDQNTLAIIFGVIGALGVLFGVYKHFSTLKVAKIVFDYKEMADFDLPKEFFENIPSMPISFEIVNNGNKVAENLIFTSGFRSNIEDNRIEASEKYDVTLGKNKMILKADKLNPAEKIKIYLNCKKLPDPNISIVKDLNLTISEGNVQSKDSLVKQEKIVEVIIESMPFGLGRFYNIISKK